MGVNTTPTRPSLSVCLSVCFSVLKKGYGSMVGWSSVSCGFHVHKHELRENSFSGLFFMDEQNMKFLLISDPQPSCSVCSLSWVTVVVCFLPRCPNSGVLPRPPLRFFFFFPFLPPFVVFSPSLLRIPILLPCFPLHTGCVCVRCD